MRVSGPLAYVLAALILAFLAYYIRPLYAIVALIIIILLMRAL
jgi:uncharacterized membrane protein YvlD (DUF360 family)